MERAQRNPSVIFRKCLHCRSPGNPRGGHSTSLGCAVISSNHAKRRIGHKSESTRPNFWRRWEFNRTVSANHHPHPLARSAQSPGQCWAASRTALRPSRAAWSVPDGRDGRLSQQCSAGHAQARTSSISCPRQTSSAYRRKDEPRSRRADRTPTGGRDGWFPTWAALHQPGARESRFQRPTRTAVAPVVSFTTASSRVFARRSITFEARNHWLNDVDALSQRFQLLLFSLKTTKRSERVFSRTRRN